MMCNDARERILQSLNITEIIEHYADITIDRQHRCACPIHGGKNRNLAIYPKTNSFYCFTCGAGGDLIKFVAKLYDITYADAMKKLDGDYNLGTFERQHKTYATIAKEQAQRKRKQREAAAFRDYQLFSYDLLTRYFKWLRRQPENAATRHDMAYIERLLDKHLDLEENPIQLEIKALIRALHTKHRKEVRQ
ncbi:MAG: hypothetical protein J1F61_06415 [Clostridiales bacterium]|nr:hypothetical protein [Clostridiales bacterium]